MVVTSRLPFLVSWALYCLLPVTATPVLVNQTAEVNAITQNDSLPLLPPYPFPKNSHEWTDEFEGKQWYYKIHAFRYPSVYLIYAQAFIDSAIEAFERKVSARSSQPKKTSPAGMVGEFIA